MNEAIVDKVSVAIWLSPAGVKLLQTYPEDAPSYAVVQHGTDMTSEGWVKLQEVDIEVPRRPYASLLVPVLAALEAEEAMIKKQFAVALIELRNRREQFLALENDA